MSSRKRRRIANTNRDKDDVKPKSRIEIEKSICKHKLSALDQEESLTKENRFTADEMKRLLEAFNEKGFPVFRDTKLLHQYLPNRREADLKGLLERLRNSLLGNPTTSSEAKDESDTNFKLQYLSTWQNLCHKVLGNFAKDRKVNLDDAFPDVLMVMANEMKQSVRIDNQETSIDYSKLIESFAQLLTGKFPERPSGANALLSMKLFYDLGEVANSIDPKNIISTIADGSWAKRVKPACDERLDLALQGLDKIDGRIKKCPTFNDLKKDRSLEALSLELPKIRRITDVLNPLHIDINLNQALLKCFIDTSI